MLYSPSKSSKNKSYRRKITQSQFYNRQHGFDSARRYIEDFPQHLLALPSESLTHITSFLDPSSLLKLSRVCRALYEHVKDDNTWHRAFAWQFLDVDPTRDISSAARPFQTRLIRRFAETWREEFIFRYKLARNWQLSRSSPVVYSPCHGAHISSILVLPSNDPPALLAFSSQTGIVYRSFPLRGKRLRCCMSSQYHPEFSLNGHMDLEHPPDFRLLWGAFAMARQGMMVRVAWGLSLGNVVVMSPENPFDMSNGAKVVAIREASDTGWGHEGTVSALAWGSGANEGYFITGGVDGTIKLWKASGDDPAWTKHPVWSSSSTPLPGTLPIALVAYGAGEIAAVARIDGDIVIYHGLQLDTANFVLANPTMVHQTCIDCPILRTAGDTSPEFLTFDLYGSASSPALLVAYKSDTHFYRIDISSSGHDLTRFDASAPITCISLCCARPGYETDEANVVLAGDQLGTISVYDWDARSSDGTTPIHAFHAHSAAVTSIAQNSESIVIVSGSADGQIKIWDAVTFTLIRVVLFAASGVEEGRGGIQVEIYRDMLFAFEGKEVFAWKVGKARPEGSRNYKKKKPKRGVYSKHHSQQELAEIIADYEHAPEPAPAHGAQREREQRKELERLGLDEESAVAYLLMLSREEEEARRRANEVDEGVFETDIGEEPGAPATLRLPAAADFPPMRVGLDLTCTSKWSAASSPGSSGARGSWSDVVSRSVRVGGEGEDDELRLAVELSLMELRKVPESG